MPCDAPMQSAGELGDAHRGPTMRKVVNVRFTRLAATAAIVSIGLLVALALPAPASAATYSVRNFGARGGGANDSAAFNRAITYAHLHGGGVVYVPRGTYSLVQVYLMSHVYLHIEAGTVLRVASGATNNQSIFYLASKGVYTTNTRTYITHTGVIGVHGLFTVDLSHTPTPRNHAIKVINVQHFTIANMRAIQNNSNPRGSPSSYAAVITFQSDSASRLTGVMYHPLYGWISNIHVTQAPYSFGATQITSGAYLHFFNISSAGGIALRFETDAPFPSRVRNVTGSNIVCAYGHAAVSFSPHAQNNYNVDITGVRAYRCESGVRIGGDTLTGSGGHFYNSSVTGGLVLAGLGAQLRDTRLGSGSGGWWVLGRSAQCISHSASARFVVVVRGVVCRGF
jgi:hypothetical protein